MKEFEVLHNLNNWSFNQIIYGVPEVAQKRLDRDIAEATYNANQEHINVTKLKLRILENQLAREWGASGKGDL